jgi:hypothetical protein
MEVKKAKIGSTAGKWLGWLGICIGAVGFFWQGIILGLCAAVLGIIGLFSEQRKLNIVTVIVGVVAFIISIV